MRYAVVTAGRVMNVVTSAQKLEDNWFASDTAQIGDGWDGQEFSHDAPAATVPPSVTARQAKEALIRAGLVGSVQPAIDAIADSMQRAIAQNYWDESTEFERDRPILNQLAQAMSLSAEQVDTLFVQAAAL